MRRRSFCLVPLIFCGCSGSRPLTVGSKNFTEQLILGEIVAQHLERRLGQKVQRKFDLGGTLLAHQALVNGAIDLYPEYTGTALTAILKLPPVADAAAALDRVRAEYRKSWGLEWMAPLGFNNSFAMVVSGEQARRRRLETLSQAARYAWRLGAGYEFVQRPDGLAGLIKTYHLRLDGPPKTMDLGLLYRALEEGKVDMVAANATDGLLSVLDVTPLRDDQAYFPPYEAALVVRSGLLSRNPRIRYALSELAATFSTAAMRKLNYEVDGGHRAPREVAAHFLRERGLSR